MKYYPEVPIWWYVMIGVTTFAFVCTAIKMVPTQLPIWAAIVGLLISFSFAIPMATLQAIANQPVLSPVIYELIASYMLPGRPIANAIFKTVIYTTTEQTCKFAGNMKLGHYMKIPPHTNFTIQVIATIIVCIWITFIQDWMLDNIEDICTPSQKQGFICPLSTALFSESIIFGAVGPQHLFSPGAP